MSLRLPSARYRKNDGEKYEIRHHRCLSVAQERRDNARQRHESEQAARDQQELVGGYQSQAEHEKKRVRAGRAQRNAQTPVDQDGVQQINSSDAKHARLFPKRGNNQVRVDGGYRLRIAKAQPCSCGSAGREGPQ